MSIDLETCRLVIFDLDGTLVNTFDDIAAAVNHTLDEWALPHHEVYDITQHVGNGVRVLLDWALNHANGCKPGWADDLIIEKAVRLWREYYLEHPVDFSRAYPNIPEVLARLREKGIAIALLSNKLQEIVERILETLNIRQYFKYVIGENTNIARKPAPDGIIYIMNQMGAAPHETWMVGDSMPDIQAAKGAGCRLCAVSWGSASREELKKMGAERIADSPMDLVTP